MALCGPGLFCQRSEGLDLGSESRVSLGGSISGHMCRGSAVWLSGSFHSNLDIKGRLSIVLHIKTCFTSRWFTGDHSTVLGHSP